MLGTEVGRQKLLRRTLLNEPVVFFRQEDGTPVALADKCAHRHAPPRGKAVGDNIQCPYHGLEYNAAGDCVRVPGQSQIRRDAGCSPTRWWNGTSGCGSGWVIRR